MSQTHTVGRVATTVHKGESGKIEVIYHATRVVAFDEKEIILDNGGYRTVTTKRRMNQASNQYGLGFQVYQKDHEWFVSYNGVDIPYTERVIMLGRA